MEVLELAKAGKIRSHVERFPLDRVADAYDKLRAADLDGRRDLPARMSARLG